jgi:tripartite-type tricarboxylate transporter receptor subunit TctC
MNAIMRPTTGVEPAQSSTSMVEETVRRISGVIAALALLLALGLPSATSAQNWPSKPIKMIVPFPAGGGTDFIARLMAQQLSKRLGQQVFVENRGGANGAIGLAALKQSDPDGYTIAASSDTPMVVNPALQANLPYKPLEDFIPVATMVRFPGLIAVHPSVPYRSVAELIAAAKAKPGSLAYASAGIGNFSHLAMELFMMQAGVKMLHVPYKGTGPAAMALVGGEVQLAFNNVQTTLQNIRAGQLVPLGVGEPERVAVLPNVPTIAETVPGFGMAPWVGIIVPAKTPKEIVDRLNREVTAVMNEPEVVKVLTDQQVTPFRLGQAEFSKLVKDDTEKWAKVIATAGIKVEDAR